jgi:putative ABC transport system substrate-binding protein
MNRRDTLLALIALGASPLAAEAQQAQKVYRIGFIASTARGSPIGAFRQGLEEAGYVEGKNVVIEARYWEGHAERAHGLVTEVLRLNVDLLVVGSVQTALAAKRATTSVPIVFASIFDPVAAGVVTNLARPGGNITGTAFGVGGEGFAGKWVELLKEAAPGVSHLAALTNSANSISVAAAKEIQAVTTLLKVKLDVLDARNDTNLDKTLTALSARGAQAIIVTGDPFFSVNTNRLVEFAARNRLPTIYYSKPFVQAGGLMSYGGSISDSWRRAGRYVDRILKGTKPGELAVEQPTTFELVINLKTAKALGITIPQSLLIRASELIQ